MKNSLWHILCYDTLVASFDGIYCTCLININTIRRATLHRQKVLHVCHVYGCWYISYMNLSDMQQITYCLLIMSSRKNSEPLWTIDISQWCIARGKHQLQAVNDAVTASLFIVSHNITFLTQLQCIWNITYRKISNISCTKSQNLNDSPLVLWLSFIQCFEARC